MTPSAQKISHALNVMSSAYSMRLEEFICDFKIKSGSKTFNTHRLILATNSGYFRSLFSSNMAEAQQDYVTMEVVESNIMQQCIKYMYTSECGLQPDSVSQVLHAANYLQILSLEKVCFEYLLKILSPNNSLFVVKLARTFNHQDVVRAAEDKIQKNLETVLSLNLFKDVTEQDLLRYISNSNYEVAWKALTTWCQGKEKEFPKLVENVNFSDFSFHFLLETVLKHHLVKKSQNVKSLVIQALFNDSSRLEDNLDVRNCFLLKRLSNDRESEEVILKFMKESFSTIITKPEFGSLSKPEFMSLLNFPKMEAAESKWEAILKWVKKDEHQRKQHFTDLFCLLDLSKLSLTFLKETVRQEPLVQANMTCMGLLVDAVFNQADQGEKRSTSPPIVGVVEKPYEEEPYEEEPYESSGSSQPQQQHSTELTPGTRVVRGPDWEYGYQDKYGEGTVHVIASKKGWVPVRWDNGGLYRYRMGADGKYDLTVVSSTEKQSQQSPSDGFADIPLRVRLRAAEARNFWRSKKG